MLDHDAHVLAWSRQVPPYDLACDWCFYRMPHGPRQHDAYVRWAAEDRNRNDVRGRRG